jgi:hypothetical protein
MHEKSVENNGKRRGRGESHRHVITTVMHRTLRIAATTNWMSPAGRSCADFFSIRLIRHPIQMGYAPHRHEACSEKYALYVNECECVPLLLMIFVRRSPFLQSKAEKKKSCDCVLVPLSWHTLLSPLCSCIIK